MRAYNKENCHLFILSSRFAEVVLKIEITAATSCGIHGIMETFCRQFNTIIN
jgi:hypothetical protein